MFKENGQNCLESSTKLSSSETVNSKPETVSTHDVKSISVVFGLEMKSLHIIHSFLLDGKSIPSFVEFHFVEYSFPFDASLLLSVQDWTWNHEISQLSAIFLRYLVLAGLTNRFLFSAQRFSDVPASAKRRRRCMFGEILGDLATFF